MKIQKTLAAFFFTALLFICLSCQAQAATYKVAEVSVSQSRAFIIYGDGTKDEIPKVTSQAQIIAKFLNEGWELKLNYLVSNIPTFIFIKADK